MFEFRKRKAFTVGRSRLEFYEIVHPKRQQSKEALSVRKCFESIDVVG
jgi:hypothetical protein